MKKQELDRLGQFVVKCQPVESFTTEKTHSTTPREAVKSNPNWWGGCMLNTMLCLFLFSNFGMLAYSGTHANGCLLLVYGYRVQLQETTCVMKVFNVGQMLARGWSQITMVGMPMRLTTVHGPS